MNTLDDLRTSLDRHASGLADRDVSARPGAVRERVRVVRRRRAAAVGLSAAAVVGALVGGGIALLPGDAPPPPLVVRPTHPGHPGRTPVPDFPTRLDDGSLLVDDFVGPQGDPELSFRVRADTDAPQWSVYCAPARSGWFTVSFNGEKRMFGQCGTASGEAGSGWSTFEDLVRADGSPVGPGDTIEVEIRLLESQGSSALASDPRIRLGAGVYELPAPADDGPQG